MNVSSAVLTQQLDLVDCEARGQKKGQQAAKP